MKDTVVEIPVGGIDDRTGVIYEKEVKPDGNEPIYKQVHIDGDLDESSLQEEVQTDNKRKLLKTRKKNNKQKK